MCLPPTFSSSFLLCRCTLCQTSLRSVLRPALGQTQLIMKSQRGNPACRLQTPSTATITTITTIQVLCYRGWCWGTKAAACRPQTCVIGSNSGPSTLFVQSVFSSGNNLRHLQSCLYRLLTADSWCFVRSPMSERCLILYGFCNQTFFICFKGVWPGIWSVVCSLKAPSSLPLCQPLTPHLLPNHWTDWGGSMPLPGIWAPS